MKEKAPLAIFVVWHPKFGEGVSYAELVFSEFRRNVKDPLSRGMNVPVYFRYMSPLAAIADDFRFTVVVALIDMQFLMSEEYRTYLQTLQNDGRDGLLIIPVAIEKEGLNLALGNLNFSRLYEKEAKHDSLIHVIAHETVRHLYQLPDASSGPTISSPPPPLKLFISHAKADGVELAGRIKKYVEASLPLKTFFDANDIAIGYDFSQEIERYIQDAVIVAIHTDMYSSREWCRREILLAKQHNRPIVILNCFLNGESRSFPYMGNVLTVHYQSMDDDDGHTGAVWSRLITAVLKETLRLKYQELSVKHVAAILQYDLSGAVFSAYPPELVSVLQKMDLIVQDFIYPDPPLGNEELAIIQSLATKIRPASSFRFTTPSKL
jgi:hypothetical protein